MEIGKVARCFFSGLKWTLAFLLLSYAVTYAVAHLKGDVSPEWPSSTTVVFAIVFFGSAVWRSWSGWEEARRRNVAGRSLGAHLLRTLGAYCICIAASVAVGLLMGANAALLRDPVLWGVVIVFLVVSLLASWLDWRKAVLVERDSRDNG